MRRSLLVPPQPAEATWQRAVASCQEEAGYQDVVGSAKRALGNETLRELLGLSASGFSYRQGCEEGQMRECTSQLGPQQSEARLAAGHVPQR